MPDLGHTLRKYKYLQVVLSAYINCGFVLCSSGLVINVVVSFRNYDWQCQFLALSILKKHHDSSGAGDGYVNQPRSGGSNSWLI